MPGRMPPPVAPLPPRDQANMYQLVLERVVEPNVVATWSLAESLLDRDEIEAEVAESHPNAALEFRSWVSASFVRSPQNPEPELAGIRTAIFGSLWVLGFTILFAFPVGVAAAVYLEEYATDNRINRLIRTNINNLAGVPSIIYGMLGLAIFVRVLEAFTSGSAFGASEPGAVANGRTILSAGLTLGPPGVAGRHHQFAGGNPGRAAVVAAGRSGPRGHQVADDPHPCAPQRSPGNTDRHDSGHGQGIR